MNAKLVIAIVVLSIFAVYRSECQVVMVSLLFWKIEASRSIVLMVIFIIGLFTGWILAQPIYEKTIRTNV